MAKRQPDKLRCPIHPGTPLRCPRCVAAERGRLGGSKVSTRKRRAARRNARLARAARTGPQ